MLANETRIFPIQLSYAPVAWIGCVIAGIVAAGSLFSFATSPYHGHLENMFAGGLLVSPLAVFSVYCGRAAWRAPLRSVMRQLSSTSNVVLYFRLVNLPLTVDVIDNSTATAKAVPDATICQVIQFPSTAQGGPLGSVDKNGHYHTDSFHPEHTTAIVASADGYETGSVPFNPSLEHYTVSLSPRGLEEKGK